MLSFMSITNSAAALQTSRVKRGNRSAVTSSVNSQKSEKCRESGLRSLLGMGATLASRARPLYPRQPPEGDLHRPKHGHRSLLDCESEFRLVIGRTGDARNKWIKLFLAWTAEFVPLTLLDPMLEPRSAIRRS
jgi:hypothetical protein